MTEVAFGVSITVPPDRPLLALGRPQFVRRTPFGLRCLESSKRESTIKIRGRVCGSIVVHRPVSGPVINSCMVFTWTEVLPVAIRSLPPLHQQLLLHMMELPLNVPLPPCVYFRRYGITTAADLEP